MATTADDKAPPHDVSYLELCELYGAWLDAGNEWHMKAQSVPYALARKLEEAISAPKEPVKFKNGLIRYVDVYKPHITEDGEPTRPVTDITEAAELQEDGHWLFKIGVLLEAAPGAMPKRCLLIDGRFILESPISLNLELTAFANAAFHLDLENPDYQPVVGRIISEIMRYLQRSPYEPISERGRVGFVSFK